jgi:magnesium transporter
VGDPSDDDLGTLEQLGVHPLAVEDSREFGQRPKLDDYDDHVLVVFYGVQDEELVEVHLHIGASWVLSLRHGPCRPLQDARDRIAHHPPRSTEEAIYRVLDALTDTFFPAVEAIDVEIEALQDDILRCVADGQREQIFALRRRVAHLRRVVGPQRDLLATASATIEGLPGIDGDDAHDWLRDVYDHLIRVGDGLDAMRDHLAGVLDIHLSMQSNELNVVTERLTRVATIFLPLTFLTGFFGMNFGWLVDHISTAGAFFAYGVGGMIASAAAIWFVITRSRRVGQ